MLVEKTAKHIVHLPKMLEYFPDTSKVVLMVRDGRDVTYSTAKRWERLGPNFLPCVEATRWIADNFGARPYSGDPRFTKVRYEDLVTQPEATINRSVSANVAFETLGEKVWRG